MGGMVRRSGKAGVAVPLDGYSGGPASLFDWEDARSPAKSWFAES